MPIEMTPSIPETDQADERSLFAAEMAGVKAFRQDRPLRVRPATNEEACAARRAAAEQPDPQDPEHLTLEAIDLCDPFDLISYRLDGVQEGVFRKLRLGQYPVQAVLDLHQHTLKAAREALAQFLHDCHDHDIRSLLIRHGRGEKSQPPAILKSYVSHWIRTWPEVLACHSAQAMHGGYGALYVLLRKSTRQKTETRERINRRLG